MPLPTPNNRESRGDFVSRCIQLVNDKGEIKDKKQQIAVCYTQWKEAKASADAIVGSGDQETILSSPTRFNIENSSEVDSIVADIVKESPNVHESELCKEYIDQAKKVIREIISAANNIQGFLENDTYYDKLTEPWVFEKMVVSKAMLCGAEHYIEFGENEEENQKEPVQENVGLIEPTKINSEDEICQRVYDNKFGADTY